MKRKATVGLRGVSRQELDAKLSMIKIALTQNVAVEFSGHLIMEGHYISAFDGEVGMHAFINSELPSACVQAKPLLELVKKGSASTVELEVQEGVLHFKCGKTKAALPTKEMENPLPIGTIQGETWMKLPKGFNEGFALCASVAAKDISRGVLTCVMCEGDTMTGCDTYRLLQYTIDEPFPKGIETPLFIPASRVLPVIKHDAQRFAINHGMFHFVNGEGDYLSISGLSGNYPPIKNVIESAKSGTKISFPNKLGDALARIEALASESSIGKEVEITLDGELLECKAQSSGGWAKESLTGADAGDEGSIKFRAHIHHLKTIFEIGGGETAINSGNTLFFEIEGKVLYVVCKIAE